MKAHLPRRATGDAPIPSSLPPSCERRSRTESQQALPQLRPLRRLDSQDVDGASGDVSHIQRRAAQTPDPMHHPSLSVPSPHLRGHVDKTVDLLEQCRTGPTRSCLPPLGQEDAPLGGVRGDGRGEVRQARGVRPRLGEPPPEGRQRSVGGWGEERVGREGERDRRRPRAEAGGGRVECAGGARRVHAPDDGREDGADDGLLAASREGKGSDLTVEGENMKRTAART